MENNLSVCKVTKINRINCPLYTYNKGHDKIYSILFTYLPIMTFFLFW